MESARESPHNTSIYTTRSHPPLRGPPPQHPPRPAHPAAAWLEVNYSPPRPRAAQKHHQEHDFWVSFPSFPFPSFPRPHTPSHPLSVLVALHHPPPGGPDGYRVEAPPSCSPAERLGVVGPVFLRGRLAPLSPLNPNRLLSPGHPRGLAVTGASGATARWLQKPCVRARSVATEASHSGGWFQTVGGWWWRRRRRRRRRDYLGGG